jgi:hypothetical protein
MYEILYFTVSGYKMLNLGIVAKGDQIEKGRVGGNLRILSTALGLA